MGRKAPNLYIHPADSIKTLRVKYVAKLFYKILETHENDHQHEHSGQKTWQRGFQKVSQKLHGQGFSVSF